MRRGQMRLLFILIAFIYLGLDFACFSEEAVQTAEKVLSLEGIFRTSYALGGDLTGTKETGETIYVAKGDNRKTLKFLKGVLIEKVRPVWTFNKRDHINIIVFRGTLPTHGKIEITKLVSKGNSFELYAKYINFPDLDIPSQPAAIIPLGTLPRGKYSVGLYVDNQLRKKVEFKVSR